MLGKRELVSRAKKLPFPACALMVYFLCLLTVTPKQAMAEPLKGLITNAQERSQRAQEETQANAAYSEYINLVNVGDSSKAEIAAAWGKIEKLSLNRNPYAQNMHGCLLAQQPKMNSARLLELFNGAAQAGVPVAKYNYGLVLLKTNPGVAMTTISKAYQETGLEQAGVRLMLDALANGKTEQASRYANQLVLIGNPSALFVRAKIDFLAKNYQSSLEFAKKAMEAYEPNAPLLLAQLYQNGLGVSVDETQSRAWKYIYRKLADFNSGPYLNPGNDPAMEIANRWLSTHSPGKRIEYQLPLCQMGRVVQIKS